MQRRRSLQGRGGLGPNAYASVPFGEGRLKNLNGARDVGANFDGGFLATGGGGGGGRTDRWRDGMTGAPFGDCWPLEVYGL